MLDEWVAEVSAALGITGEYDADQLLDVARDVAHAVERRAAPVTTFLLGVAAGRDPNSLESAIQKVTALAEARQGG